MDKLVMLKAKKMQKIVKKNGFVLKRTNGSHEIYKRGSEMLVLVTNKDDCVYHKRLIKKHHLIV